MAKDPFAIPEPDPYKGLPKEVRALLKPKTEKRKSTRVTVDELNATGGQAFIDNPDLKSQQEDTRPAIVRVLDTIDVPRNLIANTLAGVAGADTSKLEKGTFGIPKVYMSDVLDKLGVEPGPVRAITGFIGDLAIDPLTYVPFAGVGKKLTQGAPRLLKAGMEGIETAAKTGQVGADLAAALPKLRPERIAKMLTLGKEAKVQAVRASRAATAAEKGVGLRQIVNPEKYLKSTAGPIIRPLLAGLQKGEPGALSYFAKYGQKARPILAVPFTEAGVGKIPAWVPGLGGAARKYEAVTHGLTPAGQAGFKELAQKAATKAKTGLAAIEAAKATQEAVKAVEEAKTATKAIAETQRAGKTSDLIHRLGSKFEVTPKARQKMEAILTKEPPPTKADANLMKQAVKAGKIELKTTQAAEKAQSEYTRFITSKEAPKVTQEAVRAEIGAPYLRNLPGPLGTIMGAKRHMFGPERSPLWQSMVGVRNRYGAGSELLGMKAGGAIAKELEPILKRLASAGKKEMDALRENLAHAVEAGPGGKFRKTFEAGDPIHAIFEDLQKRGVLDDPEMKAFLDKWFATHEQMMAELKARKIEIGTRSGYVKRILAPEAQKHLDVQSGQATAATAKERVGGRMSTLQDAMIGRADMVTVQLEDGSTPKMLSTNLGELAGQPYKIIDRKSISMAQWNKWAADPATAPKGLLRELPGKKFPVGGKLFAPDLAGSMRSGVATQERAKAAADLRDLVKPWSVAAPKELLDKEAMYGHLAPVNKPRIDNPFSQLAETGMFDPNVKYPTPIADMLNEMVATWDKNKAVESLMRASDTMLGFWKTATLYHPAYVLRNMFQNFFGGLMAGANPIAVALLSQDKDIRALRLAMNAEDPAALAKIARTINGQRVSGTAIYSEARKYHIIGGGRASQEMAGATPGISPLETAARKVVGRGEQVAGAVFKANQAVEDNMRLATWLHFADRGMTLKDAAIRTLVAMPDLSDLTLWEREVARRILPWYAWMRHNGALQIFHNLPRKPGYAALLPKLKNFGEGFRGDANVPENLRPEWMREQQGLQVSGDKKAGTVFLPATWFPFEEVNSAIAMAGIAPFEGPRRMVSSIRPDLKFMFEAGTGVNAFKKTSYEGGTALDLIDIARAFPQALIGKSGTALDTLLTMRPGREVARLTEMPTAGTAATRMFLGGAFQPISAQRGLSSETVRLRDQAQKLRNDINRARSVNDQALADSLIRQWMLVQKRMIKLGVPGVSKKTAKLLTGQGIPAGEPAFEGQPAYGQ